MRPCFLQIMAGSLAFSMAPAVADDPVVPGPGFAVSHYETLWTKSPFTVATADAAPESPDYSLVGIAQFDGVSYASVIDKQSQEHFLVSSDKPARGLTLVSVTRGHDTTDTLAFFHKEGQSLILKLDQPASGPGMAANSVPGMPPNPIPPPGVMTPQIPMPGVVATGYNPGQMPPPARFRPRIIRVPPPPQAQIQQPPQPP